MFQPRNFLSYLIAFGVAVTLSGCGAPDSSEKPKGMTPADGKGQEKPAAQGEHAEHAGHEGHEHPANSGEHSDPSAQADAGPVDTLKGLAELSTDDRTAAEKQRVCPVSGDVLGSSGKPVKVTVKGKTVYLCCSDCEEAIKKDPDKYLAKLKDTQQ